MYSNVFFLLVYLNSFGKVYKLVLILILTTLVFRNIFIDFLQQFFNIDDILDFSSIKSYWSTLILYQIFHLFATLDRIRLESL